MTTARERAAAVVEWVATALADPAYVVRHAAAPDNVLDRDSGTPVWSPADLTDGHPGVALLFAELAAEDSRWAPAAHEHLSAALAAPLGTRTRLYRGMIALAYAGHVASRAHGGYTGMLARLDREIGARVAAAARAACARVRAGEPVGTPEVYDVLTGLTGAGRYLLAREEPALYDVLSFLVTTALASECGAAWSWCARPACGRGTSTWAWHTACPARWRCWPAPGVPGTASPATRRRSRRWSRCWTGRAATTRRARAGHGG